MVSLGGGELIESCLLKGSVAGTVFDATIRNVFLDRWLWMHVDILGNTAGVMWMDQTSTLNTLQETGRNHVLKYNT